MPGGDMGQERQLVRALTAQREQTARRGGQIRHRYSRRRKELGSGEGRLGTIGARAKGGVAR